MLKILRFLRPSLGKMILVALLYLATVAADLALPGIMSNIVDNGINKGDFNYILIESAKMLVIASLGLTCFIVAIKMSSRITSRFSADVRSAVFEKATTLTYSDFNKMGPAALLTRSTEDIFMLREMVDMLMYGVVTVPTLFIGGIVLALSRDAMLSLVLFAAMPVIIAIVFFVGRNLLPLWERADKYIDDQNKLMRERLNGIRIIRAFNREPHEHGRMSEATHNMASNIIRANVMSNLINPVSLFFLNLAAVLIAYIGAARVSQGFALTAGNIFAVIQYVGLTSSAIMISTFSILFYPRVKANARRINEVLSIADYDASAPVSEGEVPCGDIILKDVTLRYEDAAEPAVKNLNIEIPEGKTVCFIGGNGSGKSTVVQMLMGFVQPTEGKIYFGGLPLDDYTPAQVRAGIACVFQNSTIFSGTVGENIKMGSLNATDEQVERAAKLAQIDTFIAEQDEGYSYRTEQNGSNLSGGQKQRIAIARALIKDAPVTIFDDSFSALDFLTESKLRNSLQGALLGKTQLIITQRAATAMSCDTIYVFDRGEIVGRGAHGSLMANCPVYAEIYRSQIGGDLDE